jgi:ribosomal protein S18 acetylase RimI-like enzyme
MNEITYRHPREAEIISAFRLIRRSYNNLQLRSGRQPHDEPLGDVPPLYYHLYKTDYKGCWAAYSGTMMVGFGQALIRGRQWYLAFLFVDPRFQSKGIGREILKRCLDYGKSRADSFALCTFPYNEAALGLYCSFGLMPVYPIFGMKRTEKKIMRVKPTGLRMVEDDSNKSILRINRLEKEIRGYSRLVDLRFFVSQQNYGTCNFYKGSKWVGYSIVHKKSLIGPAGSTRAGFLPDILTESLRRCFPGQADSITVFAGGSNEAVYRRLISMGFIIDSLSVFLSTKPYGDFSRYIPAPLAMF